MVNARLKWCFIIVYHGWRLIFGRCWSCSILDKHTAYGENGHRCDKCRKTFLTKHGLGIHRAKCRGVTAQSLSARVGPSGVNKRRKNAVTPLVIEKILPQHDKYGKCSKTYKSRSGRNKHAVKCGQKIVRGIPTVRQFTIHQVSVGTPMLKQYFYSLQRRPEARR